MKAAGILFLSPAGNALFLKRAATAPDFAGFWDFPAGGIEGTETAEQAALRETKEEIGFVPDGQRILLTRTRSSSVTIGMAAAMPVGSNGAPAMLPCVDGAPAASLPPDTDFTTFLQRVDEEFVPEINDEHVGWAWAPIESPPQLVHPGCAIALARITMNELDIARAIADGRLVSPQRYENVMLAAIRITGTDVAYRIKGNEFAYRNPDNYLNEEFLARCNGLPVLYLRRTGSRKDGFHPKSAVLDSEEFAERVVGSIFLPYIAGDEVWGIAKIYDDAAASDLEDKKLSTSPSVFFRDASVNSKLKLENGSTLLIEGKPTVLDHVTLCEQGVWDKGGEPTGVRSESRGDSAMTDEEKKAAEEKAKKDAEEAETKKKADEAEAKKKADEDEAKKKADADAGTQLDKTLKGIADSLGSMHKRMDSFEMKDKARDDAEQARKDAEEAEKRKAGDPEQLKADKAKKDAEDKEAEEKAKKDATDKEEKAKADSADIRKRIDEVAGLIPKSIGDADYHALVDAQARADDIYAPFGKQAPRPQAGETVQLYERRVVREMKQHSPTWKGVDLAASSAFADDAGFGVIRDQVYRESKATGMSPATVAAGELREVKKQSGGHTIIEFVGAPSVWMNDIAGHVKLKATGAWKDDSIRERR